MKTASGKLSRWFPVVIFITAFTERALLLSRLSDASLLSGHLTPGGLLSGEEGINIAASLFLTGRFADPFCLPTGATAHLAPTFPAVTAILFHVFGLGLTAATARHILNIAGFSVLFASLPAAAATLGLGRTVGILAGLGGAVYPMFRSAEVFRGRDEWAASLVLLWLTIWAFHLSGTPALRLRSAVVYGAAWGALLYIQPSTVTLFPIHLVVLLTAQRSKPRLFKARYAAVAVLLMAVVILPWTIRNRLAMGDWMFMRDNFGLELFVSNGDLAQPSHPANLASGWLCAVHPTCSVPQARKLAQIGELEFNRRAFHDAEQWILHHKASFLRLTIDRIVCFWTDLPSHRVTFAVRTLFSLASFAGLALLLRGRLTIQATLFGGILLVYPLPYYIVQYSDRYVAVISFALLLPAAFTLNRFVADLL